MDGLIRTAAKPVFAICEASVPMIVMYIGRCFGTARLIMGTARMGIDVTYSWPSARVARMDPEEVAEIICKDEISLSTGHNNVRRDKLAQRLKNYIRYPYHAAEQLMVNDIIDPRDTRPVLIRTLETLTNKRPDLMPWKKHNLIPR